MSTTAVPLVHVPLTVQPEPFPEPEDPLLECLVFLTRHHGRAYSAEALRAGLPLVQGRLSPSLFVRAAERAGLAARVVRRRLGDISELALPAILILADDQVCILLERNGRDQARIMVPGTDGGVRQVDMAALAEKYTEFAIYVLSRYRAADSQDRSVPGAEGSWFWGTLARQWWIYLQVALAAVLINVFALASSVFTLTVYDRVIPNNAIETLWVLAIGVIVLYGFDFLLRTLRGYFIDSAGRQADIALANALFDKLLNMRLADRPASSGAFANLLREIETLRDFFTSATLATVVDLPFVFFFIGVFWLIGGPIAWVMIIAVPVILVIGMIIYFPLRRFVHGEFREGQQKHGVLIETLNALETVKAVRAEPRMRRQWMNAVEISARQGHRARFLSMLAINFTVLVQQLSTVMIVVLGVYLIRAGEMTQGALIACVILGGRTLAPLAQIAQLLTRVHHVVNAYRSLNRVMQMPAEQPAHQPRLHRPELTGSLRFQNVSFAYPGQKVASLKSVNFTLRAGERVALIGRTGSGKSTLQRLALHFYPPGEGMVLLDDTDLRQIDPVDLRKAVGMVPQEILLFRGTLRENIAMGAAQASDAEILKASTIAGVHDFVRRHPAGYDMPVGERGEGLSGGQRQAIAISRALLADPKVLLMDEPTSAMDNATESEFKRRMLKILPGRTLLLATHRMSLLSLVDRVIVLDRGKIVADGPKKAVLDDLAAGKIAMAEGS